MTATQLARTATAASLLLVLLCCTSDRRQPQGSYTLDPELTFQFTKTRLVMQGGDDPNAATSLAHRLVDGTSGTAELGSDGSVSLRLRLGPDDERELEGSWRGEGQQLVCTDAEEPTRTWTLTYVDGSDALHQIVEIGDHRSELVFLPTRR